MGLKKKPQVHLIICFGKVQLEEVEGLIALFCIGYGLIQTNSKNLSPGWPLIYEKHTIIISSNP
jgi:hypothetical protein